MYKYNGGNITFCSRIAFHPFNLQGSYFKSDLVIERDIATNYVIVNVAKEVISNSLRGWERN